MKKNKLLEAVENTRKEYRDGLQMIYDALNPGQRKQLLRDEKIKQLFIRFGVIDGNS